MATAERKAIDRGWYYVIEPDEGAWAPSDRKITAGDGRTLTRRLNGHPGRVEVVDNSGLNLPIATLLRAANAVGRAQEAVDQIGHHTLVCLEAPGTPEGFDLTPKGRLRLTLDGDAVGQDPSPHPFEAKISRLLQSAPSGMELPHPAVHDLPDEAAPKALFFESLMNSDMPHNDREISQGVLHMISPLKSLSTEVVLVNAKMPIVGEERPVQGMEHLRAALAQGGIHLIGITLLEGYWEGVIHLIQTIRGMGCRAHIAVGGVMPSLAPEHVAAHLPEVSFVCRGAGEYFVPRLAELVGTSTIDSPFTEAQRAAFLHMEGMLVMERQPEGARLLSCRSDTTKKVESLDRVPLDLSFMQPRHIEGGIEINTSRGCIHRCSFCSILGRESYQARSAGSVLGLLQTYEARFQELFGDQIPGNSYRVHISDDDFACERDRTLEFFKGLIQTRFRLSSVQVAIGDLCRKEGGRVLAEPDHELLDAIKAECFADHGRPIPDSDYFADHKSRNWSSFLQIGVETYSDREIARLGKGYKREHIRTIVAELSRRDLHMDGYFILSNADTSASDLVDVFTEVSRLKLRFPRHFHMRFPVVQHLVSYFTSASHRRHIQKGRPEVMKLRGFASVPGHSEFDYPFVDHDLPQDDWVRRTVDHRFVTDEGLYTGNLQVLRTYWSQWIAELAPTDPERIRIEPLIRKLDDGARTLVFDLLRQAHTQDDTGWPGARLSPQDALTTAERVLGPKDRWLPAFRGVLREEGPRHVVIDLPAEPTPQFFRHLLDFLDSTSRPQWSAQLRTATPQARHSLQEALQSHAAGERGVLYTCDTRDTQSLFPWITSETPSDWVPPAAAQGVTVDLHPDHLDAAAHWLTRLAPLGLPISLHLLPGPWTPQREKALATLLFQVHRSAPALSMSSVQRPSVLVGPEGGITSTHGPLPRPGRLQQLTRIDRHANDLHTLGATLPRSLLKVVRSFLDWRQKQSAVQQTVA